MTGGEIIATIAWGLVVLASFVGWGELVVRVSRPRYEVSIALRAAWGAAALVAVSGPLALVSVASGRVLAAMILLGLVGCLLGGYEHRSAIVARCRLHRRLASSRPGLVVLVAIVGALLALRYLGAAADVSSNPYDDDTAYYPLAKQLYDRGSLIDPFSFRRMSSLGGTALFHALVLVGQRTEHLPLFDSGMCSVLAVGLLLSQRWPGTPVPFVARLVAAAALLTLPSMTINVASYQSGLALFLAFFISFEAATATSSSAESTRETLRAYAPAGLVAAALCTLRQNYQATLAAFLVAAFVLAVVGRRGTARLRAIAVVGGWTFVCVLPWLALLYRSNDTFLFPMMSGTYQRGAALESPDAAGLKTARFFVETLLRAEPFEAAALFALVAFALPDRSRRYLRVAEWLATLGSIYLMCSAFSRSDVSNIARYNYGFLVAAMLMTWLSSTSSRARLDAGAVLRVAAVVCAFGATFLVHAGGTQRMLATQLRDIDELKRRKGWRAPEPPIADAYRRLQSAVPEGQRLLVMVDEPYRFDFRRNEVFNLDTPGISGPAPGVPCFTGPESLAAYLLAKGIRYVAVVDYEKSVYLYRRDIWMENLFGPSEWLRNVAPYVLSVLEDLHRLSATRVKLFDDAGMTLLDLERPVAP